MKVLEPPPQVHTTKCRCIGPFSKTHVKVELSSKKPGHYFLGFQTSQLRYPLQLCIWANIMSVSHYFNRQLAHTLRQRSYTGAGHMYFSSTFLLWTTQGHSNKCFGHSKNSKLQLKLQKVFLFEVTNGGFDQKDTQIIEYKNIYNQCPQCIVSSCFLLLSCRSVGVTSRVSVLQNPILLFKSSVLDSPLTLVSKPHSSPCLESKTRRNMPHFNNDVPQ